jgi:aspartate racemase
MQVLKAVGCTSIVIPCNTAHFWYDELVKFKIPILHIVDSVADALRDINVTGTIGVMGTHATVELGLYQYMLNKSGWDCITPTKEEMNNLVQPAIDLIKSGSIEEAHPMLMTVVTSLIDRGANAVVLGCTEIPLSIRETEGNNIPLVNSIDSLVKAVIKEYTK